MRARARWSGLGLAVLCVNLAGCGSSATELARQPASATATAPAPQPTATTKPVVANVYYATNDHKLRALNPANGSVRWTFSPGQQLYQPIAAGNLVYVDAVGQPDTFYALDSATGSVVWSAPGAGNPLVANGSVYLQMNQSIIDCLDAGTGHVRWRVQLPAELATTGLSVADGTLYANRAATASTATGAPVVVSSSLTAIDMTDGAIRWTFARDNVGFNYPVVGDGSVYFEAESSANSPSGRLYALKETDGSQIWSVDAPPLANVFAHAGGVVYAGGSATGISAYRVTDGTRLWTNPDPMLSRFTAVGSVVYVNSFQGSVIALDATTGAQLWAAVVASPGYAPIVLSGLLYVAVGHTVSALVAINVRTGAIAWQRPVQGLAGPPVVADGTVYAYSSQPDNGPSPAVYAFNATDGSNLWQSQTGSNLASPLAVSGGLSGA